MAPLCDRNLIVLQSHIGFIDFIVAPTMKVLVDVLEAIFRSMEAAQASAVKTPLVTRAVPLTRRSRVPRSGTRPRQSANAHRSPPMDALLLTQT